MGVLCNHSKLQSGRRAEQPLQHSWLTTHPMKVTEVKLDFFNKNQGLIGWKRRLLTDFDKYHGSNQVINKQYIVYIYLFLFWLCWCWRLRADSPFLQWWWWFLQWCRTPGQSTGRRSLHRLPVVLQFWWNEEKQRRWTVDSSVIQKSISRTQTKRQLTF